MAILQAILALLLRQTGKALNVAFSWATNTLFGKVPEHRRIYLSGVALGAVVWLVVALGVLLPRVGAFLIAFVPLRDVLDADIIRLIMLAAAVLVPLAVGYVTRFLVAPEQRPAGWRANARAVLRGYPYTVGMALAILLTLIGLPLLLLRDWLRGWTTAHVPAQVEPKCYFRVLDQVQHVLEQGGLPTVRRPAGQLVRWPGKVLALFAGDGMANLVADELTALHGRRLEVLLHPSDLVVRGKPGEVARARALLAEHLTFPDAHFTWTKEAQDVEDRLVALWRAARGEDRAAALERLGALEAEMKTLPITYEEWEVLFRARLMVELALRRGSRFDGREADADAPPEHATT